MGVARRLAAERPARPCHRHHLGGHRPCPRVGKPLDALPAAQADVLERRHGRGVAAPDRAGGVLQIIRIGGLLPALADAGNIYLSIDKDVFAEDVVKTNWDQGVFRLSHTEAVLAACAGRVIGADVCGDVSDYEYASPFKRFLSRLDGQEPCDPQALRGWQEGQRAVNAALLESLGKVLREPEASTRVSPILRRFF